MPMADTKDSQATVHTAPRNISVQHVAKLMAARGVSAVVVVDGLKPVGIVTGHDIMVRVTAPGLDTAKVMAGTIMSSPLVTVAESESIGDAVALMVRHGIRQLPIVDQTGGLVTLLTLDEILSLNLADSSVLIDIVREQMRRSAGDSPGPRDPSAVTFADVAPPPVLPRATPLGTIGVLATKSAVVPMVKRRPLTRFHYSMRAWYYRNRLPVLLMVGAVLLGTAVTLYVSAFYSYKPAYYDPKEDSREIQLKQKELEELQQKRSERDRQSLSPSEQPR